MSETSSEYGDGKAWADLSAQMYGGGNVADSDCNADSNG